jgi:hypothetical protein
MLRSQFKKWSQSGAEKVRARNEADSLSGEDALVLAYDELKATRKDRRQPPEGDVVRTGSFSIPLSSALR